MDAVKNFAYSNVVSVGAPAAISIIDVQSVFANGTQALPAFASNPANGDTIIVVVSTQGDGLQHSMSDNYGNTYVQAGTNANGAGNAMQLYYAKNVVGGSAFVVTLTNPVGSRCVVVAYCVRGLDPVAPYNGDYLGATGLPSVLPSVGPTTITPPASSFFVTANYEVSTFAPTDGSGWNAIADGFDAGMLARSRMDVHGSQFWNGRSEYKIASAVQTGSWGGTPTGSGGNWAANIASFRQSPRMPLTVTTGEGARFPVAPFNAPVWPTGVKPLPTNAEVVRVWSRASDVMTIERTQEGSSLRTIVAGDQIAQAITAKSLTDREPGMRLLEQYAAANSASLVFTSLSSDYDDYLLEFVGLIPASGAPSLLLQMSITGGASWDVTSSHYKYGLTYVNQSASTGVISSGEPGFNLGGTVAPGGPGISGSVQSFRPGNASYPKAFIFRSGLYHTDTNYYTFHGGGHFVTPLNPVTAFKVLFNGSINIASGSVRLYGLVK